MTVGASMGLRGYLGYVFGVPEPALKLVLGILAGYPLALIYRKKLYNQTQEVQCLYFILSGLTIGFWNYGYGMFHVLFSILFAYATIAILKATFLTVAIICMFNMTYLLVGYYNTSTPSYDITWTMPYCILVLRLIGVAFDIWDGTKQKKELSSDSVKTALSAPPTLLQMMAHSLFPSAFLVGPQFSMRRFLDFLEGKFHSKDSKGNLLPPASEKAALKRFLGGVAYLAIHECLGLLVSDKFLLSEDFGQMCIFKRLLLLGVWGRYTLYKYISIWMITEGACIFFGMSYKPETDDWGGVKNIKVRVFENSTEFNHYIQSFNVNTNHWVAQHIYKRLKFLGNKYYSQLGVLLFLAVWHGLHSGYYVAFFHEFVVMYVEKDVQSFIKSHDSLKAFLNHPASKAVLQVLLRLYTFIFMGWALLPFAYLQYPKYWKAFSNCGYAGFILHYFWPLFYAPILRMVFKKKQHKTEPTEENQKKQD